MPHTFVIIGIIILAAVVLTWIIPAGEYVRFENAEGIKVIDPTQFSYVDRTPVPDSAFYRQSVYRKD